VDTAWLYHRHRHHPLTVLTPTGFTQAVFEARAINDRGVRDPDPARQTFIHNQPPLLRLVGKPNSLGTRHDVRVRHRGLDVVDPTGTPTR
jgi:hypothetical protein